MMSAVYSLALIDYFEDSYLPEMLESAPHDQVRQIRNAVGRADLMLGHVATIGDLVDPSFAKTYVEHLLQKGFTAKRAEAFAACLREIYDGARQDRQVRAQHQQHKRKPQNPNRQRTEGIDPIVRAALRGTRAVSPAFLSMLEPDDQVCSGEL